MNNSRNTAGTLFLNILAMLLCASVFIGSTLAWYILSVTNESNKIQVGELDITVLDGEGNKLEPTIESGVEREAILFKGISWRPGTLAYENLTIKNDGSLVFDYEISIKVKAGNTIKDGDEEDNNNKSLQDVIKVAVVEGHIASDKDDAGVIAAVSGWTSIENFKTEGSVETSDAAMEGSGEKELAVVIYWEETANDSDYNVSTSNTSDGKPLFVELGLQFDATQEGNQ